MIWLAVVVASASLGISLAVAWVLQRARLIGLQLAGLSFLSVIVPLASVLLSGWVMFHMGADVKILTVAVASATAAVIAGLLLARSIAKPLRALRIAAGSIAAGNLGARAPVHGGGELAAVGQAFNTMATSVEQLFDARRELVSWASHDLRTPLASLRAMIEAAEDGLVEPDEYLPILSEQAAKLGGLVDDLFELVQLDAGALTLHTQPSQVAEIVGSTLRTIAPEAVARDVTLEAHVNAATTAIVAPDKIERVLTNIVANAVRHAAQPGHVSVQVEEQPDTIVVHVDDDGEGLGDEALARMFERFWRSDRARTGNGGGLGLAVARGVVEAHGGTIWAENRAQGGARISFTLPPAPSTEHNRPLSSAQFGQ
jgi:signal transduction histidine kinase